MKSKRPAIFPTDIIVELFPADDWFTNHRVSFDMTMRFDDVLEPQRLRSSLERLISLDGWRKLGARLRKNSKGNLEYHIPIQFNDQRPAIRYSSKRIDTVIQAHPLDLDFPVSVDKPTIFPPSRNSRIPMGMEDTPKYLKDYIYADEPQLALHIVSFQNATLVTITWLHTLFDILGQYELFKAWSLVMAGQQDLLPAVHGFSQDPLAAFGLKPEEELLMNMYEMHGLDKLEFFGRFIWDNIRWPKSESRVICLPAHFVQDLKRQAAEEAAIDFRTGDPKFVSTGDVLAAWWARIQAHHLFAGDSYHSVNLINVFNLRNVLKNDLLPADKVYLGNAASAVCTFFPVGHLMDRTLGWAATQVRQTIINDGTRAQQEAGYHIFRKKRRSKGLPSVFGEPDSFGVCITNWTKGSLFNVDFSHAIKPGNSRMRNGLNVSEIPVGRPSHVATNLNLRMPLRNWCCVLGHDAAGNYWLSARLRKGLWPVVLEQVEGAIESKSCKS